VANGEKPKWKQFEELVANIQKALAENATVTPNDHILGKITGVMRQIDVSVRQKAGQFDLLIVIDCKDYGEPVDVKSVEEFMGLVQDVGANKGAMVAPNGFTPAAKTRAEKAGVDLFRPVDTGEHQWKAYAALPALCVFTELAKFSISFSWSGYGAIPTDVHPRDLILYDESERALGSIGVLLQRKWRDGKLPRGEGFHNNLPVADCATKVKAGNTFSAINVTASIKVEHRFYFGSIPLAQISGFRNELTGTVIAKRLLTDFITPRDVEEKWQRISDPKELAVKPATTVHAVITLDIGDAGPGHRSVAFGIEAKDGLNLELNSGANPPS
jgi:hypothetical protein